MAQAMQIKAPCWLIVEGSIDNSRLGVFSLWNVSISPSTHAGTSFLASFTIVQQNLFIEFLEAWYQIFLVCVNLSKSKKQVNLA